MVCTWAYLFNYDRWWERKNYRSGRTWANGRLDFPVLARHHSIMPRSPLPRMRKLALSLPEAHEEEAWGEPTFRVKNKISRRFFVKEK
ncbi:MAG TPA: hypothetical protein VJV97_10515 [Gemmatimonadaceae bacterium]|nr:hypothetical protein [Gemmatimonadaceae bacterium]